MIPPRRSLADLALRAPPRRGSARREPVRDAGGGDAEAPRDPAPAPGAEAGSRTSDAEGGHGPALGAVDGRPHREESLLELLRGDRVALALHPRELPPQRPRVGEGTGGDGGERAAQEGLAGI